MRALDALLRKWVREDMRERALDARALRESRWQHVVIVFSVRSDTYASLVWC